MSCQVRVEVFWSGAERRAAQADALGFEREAPARANTRKVKIHTRTHARTHAHTYRLFCDFRHSTFCWLWQPAGTPGSSRSWPREGLARREALLSGVQIKETRYNVLIGHRQGLKEINFFGFFFLLSFFFFRNPQQASLCKLVHICFENGCRLELNQSAAAEHLPHFCWRVFLSVIGHLRSSPSSRPAGICVR